MLDTLASPLLQRILLAGLLGSLAAGIVGSFVVVKRMASVTGGVAHAAFGGVGLGVYLGVPPLLGAMGFGLVAGLAVGWAYRRLQSSLDTAIAMIWSVGMAVGVVFVQLAPGYTPDLTSYLFGSLLFASWDYVALVAALDAVIVLLVLGLFDALQAVSFDEEYAAIVGLRVDVLWYLIMGLVALSVVSLIRLVGVILAIALMTMPAATARHWAGGLQSMILISCVVAAGATTVGILAAYAASGAGVSLPTGPLIILVTAATYGISRVLNARRSRRHLPVTEGATT